MRWLRPLTGITQQNWFGAQRILGRGKPLGNSSWRLSPGFTGTVLSASTDTWVMFPRQSSKQRSMLGPTGHKSWPESHTRVHTVSARPR
jgi:hypothetical protein